MSEEKRKEHSVLFEHSRISLTYSVANGRYIFLFFSCRFFLFRAAFQLHNVLETTHSKLFLFFTQSSHPFPMSPPLPRPPARQSRPHWLAEITDFNVESEVTVLSLGEDSPADGRPGRARWLIPNQTTKWPWSCLSGTSIKPHRPNMSDIACLLDSLKPVTLIGWGSRYSRTPCTLALLQSPRKVPAENNPLFSQSLPKGWQWSE